VQERRDTAGTAGFGDPLKTQNTAAGMTLRESHRRRDYFASSSHRRRFGSHPQGFVKKGVSNSRDVGSAKDEPKKSARYP